MTKKTTTSEILLPLPAGKKHAVTIGAICLMLSISMFGSGFFIIQGPVLEQMNASEYYSLLTVFASLGVAIMTPIGGKLGDLLGRRNVILFSGLLCAACGIGMSLIRIAVPFILLRLLLGLAQGAFTAAPYILMREINAPEDVPRSMGLLASAVAIGSFGGSILLGALADMGFLRLAIIIPAIPLLIGVLLITLNLPNRRQEGTVVIDIPGILCLSLLLSAFCLTMNFGPVIGWADLKILSGILLTVILLFIFVRLEQKTAEPIVPMYLFSNRQYTTLLIVAFLCYFYQSAMNAYAPVAVQKVLGLSATISGSLQLPRSILTMILPALFGTWVGKSRKNQTAAIAFACGFVVISFLPLGFTTSSTSIVVYFAAIALTGVAESFRSVSVTPAAQNALSSKDLGVGTALVTFVNSLSSLFSSAIYGVVYEMNSSSVQSAVNQIFLLASAVSAVGLLIVLFFVRRQTKGE